MKRYAHYPFYAAALVSLLGIFLQWEWVKGAWDGWFPFWAVTVAELIRVKNNVQAGVVEKASRGFQRFALASVLLSFVFMGGLILYTKYITQKWDREAVQEYLDARKAREK